MKPFRCMVQNYISETHFFFRGSLVGEMQMPEIDWGKVKSLHFDFKDLEYINSYGIKSWVKFIKQVTEKHHQDPIHFHNCPKVIIDQINTIKGFAPYSYVMESFNVPVYCEACDHSEDVAYRLGREFQQPSALEDVMHPKVDCPLCNARMSIDVLVKKFFHFLGSEPDQSPPTESK